VGVVAKVWHKAGDIAVADSADPILRVIDPSRTQVAVQAPIAQMDRLTPGRTATVSSGLGTPETASLSSRASPATPGAATVEVRFGFLGPSALKIDTPVQVEVLLDERRDVVVVPDQAIVRDAGLSIVWVARQDGRAERREVRQGLKVGGFTQVLSGIVAGDEVITSGLAQLQDGSPITISR
jgi:RND family efflux transporter MFP subunit